MTANIFSSFFFVNRPRELKRKWIFIYKFKFSLVSSRSIDFFVCCAVFVFNLVNWNRWRKRSHWRGGKKNRRRKKNRARGDNLKYLIFGAEFENLNYLSSGSNWSRMYSKYREFRALLCRWTARGDFDLFTKWRRHKWKI